MITIDINPVLFSLGPLSVRWYGLMYIVGITVGLLVVWPYVKSKGITGEQFEKVVLWSILAGFVGARLYYVLQQPLEQYLANPVSIIAVWEGGMAFFGAIIAVVLTVVIITWRAKLPIWKFLDITVIFASVGQFFGRIGNIINGDIIGYPTTLPWGFIYTNPNSFPPRHDIAYQPAAVYEAIINIIIFSILWTFRNKVRPGMLFFIYLFAYSISQLGIFFLRDNEIVLWSLKQAQLTAIGVLIVTAIGFMWFIRSNQHLKGSEESIKQ
jgi:phosphatidylglycerol---prolipoprotein diacylglyceryl transferase